VISPTRRILHDNTQHSKQTEIHRNPLYKWSARRTDLYQTTHNTHNRQTSIRLLSTSDQPVAQTSFRQHTKFTTDRHPYDSSLQLISPSHRPLPDNTQHSQQTDIHRTLLYKWSAPRRDLYLTTHNTHNRQTSRGLLITRDQPVAQTSRYQHTTHTTDRTSIRLLCTIDQPVAQNSTWQHTTMTTDRYPLDSSVQGISPTQRPLPENTQHSQQTDFNKTPLYKWAARRTDLYLTTHKIHNRHPYDSSVQVISPSHRPLPDNT